MAKETLQILFLEDIPADVQLVKRALRESGLEFHLESVASREAFRGALKRERPDVILLDHGHARFDGFSALAMARKRYPDVPLLFVTGSGSEEMATRARKEGARELVPKDRLSELGPAVQRALRDARFEARNAAVVASAFDAIVTIDARGIVCDWNPAAEKMFGIARGEAVGRELAELIIPPRERSAHREGLARQVADGAPGRVGQRLELAAWRRDGSEFPVELALARLQGQQPPLFTGFLRDITQRKQAEEALHHSEERYRLLLESVTDYAIFMLDTKGRISSWNAGAERLLGYPAAEIVGRHLSVFFTEEDNRQGHPHTEFQKALAEGRARSEGWCVRRDGQRIWSDWTYTAIRNAAGQLTGYATVAHDITELRRAREALEHSEERYRQLVEVSPMAIVVHDGERIIFANPAAARLLGAESPEILLGRAIRDFIRPEDRRQLEKRLDRVRAGLTVPFLERQALRLDGSVVDLEVTATPVALPGQSQASAVLVVALDITERKRTERALRESEDRFRLAVESVQDYGIYMLDAEGRVVTWNAGAERIEGYRADEVIGRPFSLFFDPEQVAAGLPERELQKAVENGVSRSELWCRRKDGSRYLSEWVLTAVRDAGGRLTGFLRVTHDVTEQRRAQEEIARLNAELEARVAQRTAQLAAANNELEAFSYSVSHDLRAPLRHIEGFVELLEQGAARQLDETNREYLRIIRGASEHMSRLIDALLSFSRMGRVPLVKTRVSLRPLVDQVLRDLQYDTAGRRIEWVIGDLPAVQGDASLLRQVLFNLLANAVKYTRTRERARIEIGARVTPREVICYVTDNGIGFDMQYADKLFGVFQRLHSPAEFEGTGIGLANVRRIIQRHGGRVWAEGQVDVGATFYFALPRESPKTRAPTSGPSPRA